MFVYKLSEKQRCAQLSSEILLINAETGWYGSVEGDISMIWEMSFGFHCYFLLGTMQLIVY